MTNSEMFKAAHAGAREDVAYNAELPVIMRKSYAYYFRLRLLNEQRTKREATATLVRGFQVHEGRVWA